MLRQHFNGYIVVMAGVEGAINFTHAAGADGGEDFIRAQPCSSREGHQALILAQRPSRDERLQIIDPSFAICYDLC